VVNLKKQSQFVEAGMNISILQKKDYENKSALRLRENKANFAGLVDWR
jgi:hypothetical protein